MVQVLTTKTEKKNRTFVISKIVVSLHSGTIATPHGEGPRDGVGRTGRCLATRASLQSPIGLGRSLIVFQNF